MNTIFGSLVLSSDRKLTDLPILESDKLTIRTGSHINDSHKGIWTEASDIELSEVYLPQRYKLMTVLTSSNKDLLLSGLEGLDAKWENARQLYKLTQMLKTFSPPMVAVVNSVTTSLDMLSGAFYLMALGTPLFVNLVFDLEEHSVRLVWSTFDFKQEMQNRKHYRYVFYPMPTLTDRSLFIHSHSVCSRWWKYKRLFGEGRHGLLRSCNALELVLYKDPDLPTL